PAGLRDGLVSQRAGLVAAGVDLTTLAVADTAVVGDVVVGDRAGRDRLGLERLEVGPAVLTGDHAGQVVILEILDALALDQNLAVGLGQRRRDPGRRMRRHLATKLLLFVAGDARDPDPECDSDDDGER